MTPNINVSLISKFKNFWNLVYSRHFHFDDVIRKYVSVLNQQILHVKNREIYIQLVSKGSYLHFEILTGKRRHANIA